MYTDFASCSLIKATESDFEDALRLYKALVGTKDCIWDDDYPNEDIIQGDIANSALYLLKDKDGVIIAAFTLLSEKTHNAIGCWKGKNPCGIMRVAVKNGMHRCGIGTFIVNSAKELIKNAGYDSVILLVSPLNHSALSLYKKCGFTYRDECFMYDIQWHCYEYLLV